MGKKDNNINSDVKRKSIVARALNSSYMLKLLSSATLGMIILITATAFSKTSQYVPEQATSIPQNTILSSEKIETGEPVKKIITYETSEICFIGGARIKSMESVVSTDASFITTDDDTVEWLGSEAEKELKTKEKIKLCIVCVGISELDKSTAYSQVLNKWSSLFPKISFVLLNIGPVDESISQEITNEQIEKFNKLLQKKMNSKWKILDQFEFLSEDSIETKDGLIYSNNLNENLFNWIISQTKNEERIEYITTPAVTEN